MSKRILSLMTGLAILILAVALSGCSGSKLSGTYTNPDDSSNYAVFDGNAVTFYEGGNQVRSGTFRESAKTSRGDYLLTITNDGVSPEERFWLDGNRETIYEAIFGDDAGTAGTVGEVAFTKKD
jgi:hypothetical protein